jgi:hypothetical protein
VRIRLAVPDRIVSAGVLDAALEATTRANTELIENGEVPPLHEVLKRGKVKWRPEPFKDGEHFDLADVVHKRGWGDCDDLAPWLAASLRATGHDPGATAFVRRSGPKMWHAVTRLSDGHVLDPSKAAGMGGYKRGVHGTSIMGLIHDGPVFGIKPYCGKWASRCDVPMTGAPVALSGLSLHSSILGALNESIDAAFLVGDSSQLSDPGDLAALSAIQAACNGEDYGETLDALAEHLAPNVVGSIFSSLAHLVKSALPMAGNFIPIPGAGLAAQMASHLIPGGSGHHNSPGAPGQPEHPPPGGINITRGADGSIVVRL